MPESKSLKFSFVLDEGSFMRVKSALQQLTQEAQKFSKALQGGMGGGGGIQNSPQFGNLMGGGQVAGQASGARLQAQAGPKNASITSSIQENVAAFKNLGQFGSQAMKGLGDALKRSVQDQQQSIRGLQGSLEALVRTYEKLGGSGGGAVADRVASKMANVAGRLHSQRQALSDMPSVGGDLMPEVPWPGQDKARPGWAARAAAWIHTPGADGAPPGFFGGAIQGLAPTNVMGMARMGGLAIAGTGAILNEAMGGTRVYGSIEAQRSAGLTALSRQMMGGDISWLQAQRGVMADSGRRHDYQAQAGIVAPGGGPQESRWTKAAWMMAGPIGTARNLGQSILEWNGAAEAQAGFSSVIGGVKSLFGMGGPKDVSLTAAMTSEARQNTMADNAMQQIADYQNSQAFLQRRVALEGFQGSLGSRMQAGRIMGLGLNRRKANGVAFNQGNDSYLEEEIRLTEAGYDMGSKLAAVTQSRQLGLGGAHAGAMMAASAAGWGQWGGVLAQASYGARAGQTGIGLAQSALGVTSNTAAGMGIGQMAFGFDPRGTVSGAGVLAAIQGGSGLLGFTGGAGDMNAVQRTQQGLAAGQALSSGFDPYQQGRNLISAMQAAPGLSTYGQDYLANGMGFKQLLAAGQGELTSSAKAMGITQGMAKTQLAAMGSSVFERFTDQGGSDPMSLAIRRFQKSGKSLTEFMSGASGEDRESLGVFMGQELGVGEEGGLGLAGLFGGLGLDAKKMKKRGVPVGGLGEAEAAAAKGKARQLRRQQGELETDPESIMGDLAEGADKAVQKMTAFGSNLSESAQTFITSLSELTKAVNYTASQISGGRNGSGGATSSAPGSGKK
jgi:hypothetical protein